MNQNAELFYNGEDNVIQTALGIKKLFGNETLEKMGAQQVKPEGESSETPAPEKADA